MHINRKSLLLFLLPLLLNVTGCKEEKKQPTLTDIYSQSDVNSIGALVRDTKLNIVYNAPINWKINLPELSDKSEWKLRTNIPEADNYIYKPKYVYFHAQTGGIMRVGVIVINDSTVLRNERLKSYVKILDEKYSKEKISKNIFEKDNIEFVHYKIPKPNLISYELLFTNKNGELIKFDYTVQSNKYQQVKTSIESSIGSIRLINN